MNKKHPRNEDDDDFPFMKQEFLGFYEEKFSLNKITLYLDEEIREPSYYRQALYRIHNLSEDDEVDIIINTNGGRVDSAISIINAIRYTPAKVTGILDNKAYSAGSLILLSCPNIYVAEGSAMMCHMYSTGLVDKGGALISNLSFNDEQFKTLMSNIYLGFLSPKELGLLFNDKDFWFSASEIQERLLSRQKYLLKLQKQAQAQNKPKTESETTKPKKAKSTPEPEYDPKEVAFKKGKE